VGFHTFDTERADGLNDPERFRYGSREELLQHLPERPARLLDLGSGTGFYTRELAPYAGTVYAVDIQSEMHRLHREAGVAEPVQLVTADGEALPFAAGAVDAAVSTATFHESASPEALADLARVVDGRVVIVDWSGQGSGDAGPPVDQRFTAAEAESLLTDAGFETPVVAERAETFLLVGTA
jgi:Methylase involved in ubiquinone/menaquinone biosynthesis